MRFRTVVDEANSAFSRENLRKIQEISAIMMLSQELILLFSVHSAILSIIGCNNIFLTQKERLKEWASAIKNYGNYSLIKT